jgi:UDP-N-acetylmuramoyl-tripeptide--D-alanyl-D-alanine ligase
VPDAKYFENKAALIDDLKKNPLTNATILVKASRGIGLETVLDYL